ncbi:MAG: Toxin RTX-I translocation ATP-binding protein [Alphaproteobacteria bacterium MarineAlpha11_Bin1]|nr:MAG: Toxin RTX-I translocation ATP-binding protein [Alphaproteobacteria bacterium MarineAlpha11_Bin1]|tara:strand:- start:11208 stop:12860 length:1653 start_codon:yes stop_codon:yes gene_type:complete
MKRLLLQFGLNPSKTLGLLFSSLAANLLALVPAVFVILVLNRYVTYGVDATLVTLATAACLAILFEFVFRRLRYQTASRLDVDGQKKLNENVFLKFIGVKLGFMGQVPVTTLRGVFGSVDQLKNAYSPSNICAFLDAPFALLFLFALYLLCPPLCLITAVIICMLSLIITIQLNSLREVGRNINKANTLKLQLVNNAIDTPETLRLFDNEAHLHKKWQKICEAFDALHFRLSDRQDRTQSLIKAFTGLLTVAVISIGAVLVVDGQLDIGEMIGANILAARALAPIVSLCQQTEGWVRADQASKTLNDFDRLPLEQTDGSAFEDYSGKLEFRDVNFNYHSRETPVLEKLNFVLQPGEVLCVTGANGSGKSTLAKLVIGLLEPSQGYISLDGVNLKQMSLNWWRKHIVYLPQEPRFIEGTIRENFLASSASLTDDGIRKLLSVVGLEDEIDKTAGGLEQALNSSGSSLSLGVRRRLALARALVNAGKLAVLDEPTEGIDSVGASHVYNVMNNLSGSGRTLIICSHDPEVLSGAHHVLDLNDGTDAIVRSVAT